MTTRDICTEVKDADTLLRDLPRAVSIYGSARLPNHSQEYQFTEQLAKRLADMGLAVLSGGGPSIMEAANKGAFASEGLSVGLNITLPHEQKANPYQNISVAFDSFSARKATFLKYAQAHIVMAGGFGTLDELFECLTQLQTGKIPHCPIILVGREFWQGLMDWMAAQLKTRQLIHHDDLDYLYLLDDMDEIVQIIQEHFGFQAA